jgi:hypothetical protein
LFDRFCVGKIFNSCSESSLGMPGISAGHQVNILQCSRRNSMSALFYAGKENLTPAWSWKDPSGGSGAHVCPC